MFDSILILLIAVATSFSIAYVLEKFGERKKIKEIQDKINKTNKEYSAALKENNEKRIAELEKEINEFPKLVMESTFLSLKGMLIVLPIIIVVPYIIRTIFLEFTITLPFPLPIPRLTQQQLFELKSNFGAYGWFWISFIFIGGAAQLVYSRLIKKNEKKEEKIEKGVAA